jgi:hypothetical protein
MARNLSCWGLPLPLPERKRLISGDSDRTAERTLFYTFTTITTLSHILRQVSRPTTTNMKKALNRTHKQQRMNNSGRHRRRGRTRSTLRRHSGGGANSGSQDQLVMLVKDIADIHHKHADYKMFCVRMDQLLDILANNHDAKTRIDILCELAKKKCMPEDSEEQLLEKLWRNRLNTVFNNWSHLSRFGMVAALQAITKYLKPTTRGLDFLVDYANPKEAPKDTTKTSHDVLAEVEKRNSVLKVLQGYNLVEKKKPHFLHEREEYIALPNRINHISDELAHLGLSIGATGALMGTGNESTRLEKVIRKHTLNTSRKRRALPTDRNNRTINSNTHNVEPDKPKSDKPNSEQRDASWSVPAILRPSLVTSIYNAMK